MTLTLRMGAAEATLLPQRGGLLAGLTLPAPDGRPVPLVWMPPDFSQTDSGWPGGGVPVLFPFAGRVFNAGVPLQYALSGRTYGMPLHGFAYGLPWDLVERTAVAAELELRSGANTAELYPFSFTLRAKYELSERGLAITLGARNDGAPGTPPMPVAMGLHPYLRAPLGSGTGKGDCHLETSATTKVAVTPLGGAGKSSRYPETADEAAGRLTDKLFGNIILTGHTTPEAALVDAASGLAVRVRWCDPLRYLVLWTKEGEGFHCIEPWMGLPDALNNGQGVQWMPPGEVAACAIQIGLEGRWRAS